MVKRMFLPLLLGAVFCHSSYAQSPSLERATISSGSRDDKQCTATIGEAVVGFKPSTAGGGSLSIGAQPGTGGSVPTKEIVDKAAVGLYPNPTADWITLDIQQTSGDEFTVTITDVLGRIVHNVQGLSAGLHLLSLQSLPAGSYFFVVQDKKGILHYSAPIVKSTK